MRCAFERAHAATQVSRPGDRKRVIPVKKICLFGGALFASGFAAPVVAQPAFDIFNSYAVIGVQTLFIPFNETTFGPAPGPFSLVGVGSPSTVASAAPDRVVNTARASVGELSTSLTVIGFRVTEDVDVRVEWDITGIDPASPGSLSIEDLDTGEIIAAINVEPGSTTSGQVRISLRAGFDYVYAGFVNVPLEKPPAADPYMSSISLDIIAPPVPCPADLAAPIGVLDLTDIDAFIAAFTGSDPEADLAPPPDVLDLSDIDAFIGSFLAGCP